MTSKDGYDEDYQWLNQIEQQFITIAREDRKIDLQEFKTALKVKESFFATRFFEIFDDDKSGEIDLDELMNGLKSLAKGDSSYKLKFVFDVYDVDGSGSIDKSELKTVIRSCIQESSLDVSESDLDSLTDVLFDSADLDEGGSITFDELKTELEKHPDVLENLTISSAQWLRPSKPSKDKRQRWQYLTLHYWKNNVKKGVLFLTYFILNIGLFCLGCFNYRYSNIYIIIARGCGMGLNFNCSFILMCMLRKTLTFLRSFKQSEILPLDDNIKMHKVTGIMIAVLTVVHTMAHIGNAVLVSEEVYNLSVVEFIFTTKAHLGRHGLAPVSGVALDIILAIIVVCSLPIVRRSGLFQIFYWTHTLYIPFWALCIIHARNFWIWLIIPGCIFLLESILRSKILRRAAYGETFIVEVNLLPSRVTHLVISRPPNWKYKPGDYVFIQIPDIARYEWHPFTISSAPEHKGHIWLHIRSAGHWTNKLYDFFQSYDESKEGYGTFNKGYKTDIESAETGIQGLAYKRRSTIEESQVKDIKKSSLKSKQVHVQVNVDGPFGTSSREIFETEHAILVGSGIGVTPYASILQSILFRCNLATSTCPNCNESWFDPEKRGMQLKKVDFIWINRDQKNFEWFVRLLTDLEVEQSKSNGFGRIIDMHMYMTSALKKTDMKGLGLQMALELLHQKENRDVLTGLKTKTHAGRPNFDKIFQKASTEQHGNVKVFLCGPPALAKDLKKSCDKFGFEFCKENF